MPNSTKKKSEFTWGGAREGSGRKPYLKDAEKFLIRLEPRHSKILKKYGVVKKIKGGISGAIRHILDEFEFGV
jgi:hypothetical protein